MFPKNPLDFSLLFVILSKIEGKAGGHAQAHVIAAVMSLQQQLKAAKRSGPEFSRQEPIHSLKAAVSLISCHEILLKLAPVC